MSAAPNDATREALRHYRRYNLWFWFFLLCIPLGVVLPCTVSVVAFKLWGDTVSAPIGFSAFFWPLLGLAGALLIRSSRKRARRSYDLAKLAQTLNLTFTRKPDVEPFAFLKSVSFMADPHTQKVTNLFVGTPNGKLLQALDYEYTYFYGSVTEIGSQTLAVVTGGFAHLPEFGIIPTGIMGKLENAVLGKFDTIAIPHLPGLNQNFYIVGEDAPRVTAVATALSQILLSDRLLNVIVEDDRLIVFRRLTYVTAHEYQAFLAQAFRIAEVLGTRR